MRVLLFFFKLTIESKNIELLANIKVTMYNILIVILIISTIVVKMYFELHFKLFRFLITRGPPCVIFFKKKLTH
jgi:hypothetical protein